MGNRDFLSELQNQNAGWEARQSAISQRVGDFDIEQELRAGTNKLYGEGKEQIAHMVGEENLHHAEMAAPLVTGLGKYAYSKYKQGGMSAVADDVKDAATKAVGEATDKAGEAVSEAADKAGEAVSEATPSIDSATRFSGQTETVTQAAAKNFTTDAIPEGAEEALAKSRSLVSDTGELDLQPSQVTTLDAPRLTEPAPVSRYNIDTRAPELKYNLPSPRSKIQDPEVEAEGPGSAEGLQYTPMRTAEDPSMPNPHSDPWAGTSAEDEAQIRAMTEQSATLADPVAAPRSAASLAGRSEPTPESTPSLDPAAVDDVKEGEDAATKAAEDAGTKAAEDAGTKVAEDVAVEGAADALPGIGEIAMGVTGLLALGGLLGGTDGGGHGGAVVNQPVVGSASAGLAFDAAPVYDSDQYHSL